MNQNDPRLDYDDKFPVLQPVDNEVTSKPGFGFWMAVAWCIAYTLVMQLLAGIFCGLPIVLIAMGIEASRNNGNLPDANDKALLQNPTMIVATMAALICSHVVGLIFGWIILRWQCGKGWKRRIAATRLPSLTHVVLILIGFPAMICLSALVEKPITQFIPSIQDLLDKAGINFQWPGIEAIEPMLRLSPWPLALFAVAVLPGINEEFWCRGFLAQGLSGRYARWAVVLITSFLFGCIHLEPRQGFGAMLLGATIHAAYMATRSLWVAIAIHAANNGLAVIHLNGRINFPILEPVESLAERAPYHLLCGAYLLFMAVGYALFQTRCQLTPTRPGFPAWEPPAPNGVEIPPAKSGTVVTHAPLSPLSTCLVLAAAIVFGLIFSFA